jgi:hypothetical protein
MNTKKMKLKSQIAGMFFFLLMVSGFADAADPTKGTF